MDKIEAATDSVKQFSYKEFDKRFPGSKFILTTRNKDDWVRSARIKIKPMSSYVGKPDHDRISNLRIGFFGSKNFEEKLWRNSLEKYEEEVLEYFNDRKNDFLIMNICAGDGWNKLCHFLERKIPNIPFPHLNKTNYPRIYRKGRSRHV